MLDERSERRALGFSGGRNSRLTRLSLLLLAMVLLLAIPWPGIFYGLQVTQLPRGRVLMTLPFVLHHPFSLSYTHSTYLAPVIEEFEVEGTQIHLREISTNNWGVVEYYNISEAEVIQKDQGEIWMRGINFHLPKIMMIIGFIGKQKLTWENRTYSLFSLTGPGEKVQIEPVPLSPGRYLWEKVKRRWFSIGSNQRTGGRAGRTWSQKESFIPPAGDNGFSREGMPHRVGGMSPHTGDG